MFALVLGACALPPIFQFSWAKWNPSGRARQYGKSVSESQRRVPQRFKIQVYPHIPKLSDSRLKYGVRNSYGDIIIFLDDDTVVDKDFIKEVAKVFEKDHEKKISGIMGNILNVQRPNNILSNLNLAILHIFLLPTFGSGRFRYSGSPTFIHGTKETKNVEFLSGCCMAYRRKAFNDLKFDIGFLEAHLCTDDEDFPYRVSQQITDRKR